MQLRALIVYSCPSNGHFLELSDLIFPEAVDSFDIALSSSSQERGWLQRLSGFKNYFCSADKDKLLLKLNSYDFIVAYPLSFNTLAKFALGIRDSFPSEVLAYAADIGKPILLHEQTLVDAEVGMNPHLTKVYKRHWDALTSGTITGFNSENLDKKITRLIRAKKNNASLQIDGARMFITKDDVIIASESLEPLRVPSNAIITDLAKEEATMRGVSIVVE